jgi:hypothetical protein
MTCCRQTRGHGLLSGAVLSCHVVVGYGAFPGGARPPGLDIWCSVYRLGTCVTESFQWVIFFTRGCLSHVKAIMAFYACIPSCAATSGGDGMDSSTWVYAVKCMWAPAAKSRHAMRLRPPPSEALGQTMLLCSQKPPGMFDWRLESCPRSRDVGLADGWWNPACPLQSYGGKSEGVDYTQD